MASCLVDHVGDGLEEQFFFQILVASRYTAGGARLPSTALVRVASFVASCLEGLVGDLVEQRFDPSLVVDLVVSIVGVLVVCLGKRSLV